MKEYSINVMDKALNVSFSPSRSYSNVYAFVDGIENVSMPDIFSSPDGTIMMVGSTAPFDIDNTTSFENVYRLNVGGNHISLSHDTGLFR